MEPSKVYKIVPVSCGKWARARQHEQAHLKRTTLDTTHHKTIQAIHHYKTTLADPRCKTTKASIHHKTTLASHHQNAQLASTHPKSTLASTSQTTRLTRTYRKAALASHHQKTPLTSHHHKTSLADPQCSKSPLRISHLRSGPTLALNTKVRWRWLYLVLVLTLGRTSLSQRTSWVYQSHTPLTVQKNFQKFVEEAGGNSQSFRFFGNFFDSDEHKTENDEFLGSTFLEAPFKNDENEGKPFVEDSPFTISIKSILEDIPSTNPIKHIGQDFPPAKSLIKQTLHESSEVNRVPKSFYEDIFDQSLPVDSPYRTTFLPSPNPRIITSQSENNGERTNRKLGRQENGFLSKSYQPFSRSDNRKRTNRKLERQENGFLSKSYQPFSSDLLTPLPFQQHANIEGFTSQTLGNVGFSKRRSKSAYDNFSEFSGFNDKDLGSFSDEIRSTEKDVTRIGFLLRRRSFYDGPRQPPRKLFLDKHKQESMQEQDSSFNYVDKPQQEPPAFSSLHKPPSSLSQHKPPSLSSEHKPSTHSSEHKPPSPSSHAESHFGRPNFEAIISAYEANEDGHFEGPPDVSYPWGDHWTLERPHSGGPREKGGRVLRPKSDGETSLTAAGCPSQADGILYGAGAVWFERGCQRHTCVHFRGRYFVETDSCDSVIHNTSYRCQVLVDTKASYPHCCPTYQCHQDNLGRLAPDEDTEA